MWEDLQDKLMLGKVVSRKEMLIWSFALLVVEHALDVFVL
jgi:hypothetical protein